MQRQPAALAAKTFVCFTSYSTAPHLQPSTLWSQTPKVKAARQSLCSLTVGLEGLCGKSPGTFWLHCNRLTQTGPPPHNQRLMLTHKTSVVECVGTEPSPLRSIIHGIHTAGRLTGKYVDKRELKHGSAAILVGFKRLWCGFCSPPSFPHFHFWAFLCANGSVHFFFWYIYHSSPPLQCLCCIKMNESLNEWMKWMNQTIITSCPQPIFSPFPISLPSFAPYYPSAPLHLHHHLILSSSLCVLLFPHLIRNTPQVLVTKQNIYCERFSDGFLGHVRREPWSLRLIMINSLVLTVSVSC